MTEKPTEPTGTLTDLGDDGFELTVRRELDLIIDDAWSWVTSSERTAAWIGPWSGEARVGSTIQLTMVQEDGDPVVETRIDACDEPFHLAFTMDDWSLEVRLSQLDTTTEVALSQVIADKALAESYGPGWEFYLDALLFAVTGATAPKFDDYHPRMAPYYASLAEAL